MKLLELLTEMSAPFKSLFSDEEVEQAYAKAKELPEYKRILALGFTDGSSKVQAKRGNFEFDGKAASKWSPNLFKVFYKVYAHGMIRTGSTRAHTRLRVPQLTQDDLLENYRRMLERVGDVIDKRLNAVKLKRVGKKQEVQSDDPLKAVNGSLVIDAKDIKTLKGSPQKVSSFKLNNNSYLEDLEGAPEVVVNDVVIQNTWIKTLKGFPKSAKNVTLENLQDLTSLEGISDDVKVLRITNCPKLKTLEGLPESLTSFELYNIHLDTLEGFGRKFVLKCGKLRFVNFTTKSHALALLLVSNKNTFFRWKEWNDKSKLGAILDEHIEKGKAGIIDCQHDLIEAGFEEQAKV